MGPCLSEESAAVCAVVGPGSHLHDVCDALRPVVTPGPAKTPTIPTLRIWIGWMASGTAVPRPPCSCACCFRREKFRLLFIFVFACAPPDHGSLGYPDAAGSKRVGGVPRAQPRASPCNSATPPELTKPLEQNVELDWLDFRWLEMSRKAAIRHNLPEMPPAHPQPLLHLGRWDNVPDWLRAVTIFGVVVQAVAAAYLKSQLTFGQCRCWWGRSSTGGSPRVCLLGSPMLPLL